MRRTRSILLCALLCLTALASLAQAEIAQKGEVRVKVSGSFNPQRLPRSESAPISVSVGGDISNTNGGPAPRLESLRIELNKGGVIDSKGLPLCPISAIQTASTQRALSACKKALVGEGSFGAEITLAGQEPYPITGKLLAFNARQKGKAVLFGHIYAARPFATSFVIVFAITKLAKGTYGTALDAKLPKSLSTWGKLTGIKLTLSRRYTYKGERHSYISAACATPKGITKASFPFARASFGFEGGRVLSSTLNRVCRVG